MWQIIVYTVAVSTALCLPGLCEERLATMLRKPRRFAWAFTMALSILWPLAAMVWSRPAMIATSAAVEQPGQLSGRQLPVVAAQSGAAVRAADSSHIETARHRVLRLPSDRTVLAAWALVSGTILIHLIGADLSLRRSARRWRSATMFNHPLQISESTGPALLGAWRPRIVVPAWFLDESSANQTLILQHEQQHILARDPLLLRLALLLVAVAPWNLPLWWQLRRLRQAIELDCDARVLGAGAEAASYGKVLLAVTQRAGRMPGAAVAMSEPVSALELRIRSLAAGPARYSGPRALAILALWAAGVGAAVSLEAPVIPSGAGSTAPAAPTPAVSTPAPAISPTPELAAAPASAPTPATAGSAQPATPSPRTPAPAAGLVDAQGNPVDQNIIPSALLRRLNDLSAASPAPTYGSGAVAGVVSLVLNNRLKGFNLTYFDERPSLPYSSGRPSEPLTSTPAAARNNWMELPDLIASTGKLYRTHFVIDRGVRGSVDLGNLNAASISYHAFLEILGANGFVAVRSGDGVAIVPGESAQSVASPVIHAGSDMGDDAEMVRALIPVHGLVNPQLMERALSPLGQLSGTPDGNSLLVMDKVANVKRIATLVQGQSETK